MSRKAALSLLFISALCANSPILSAGQIGPGPKFGMERVSLMKTLTLTRTETRGNGVWGELFVNGKFVCYTLENDTKKIPTGSYKIHKVKRGYRLEGVEGRSNINIEVGNYPFESLGCIFVGTKKTDLGVEGSKIALLRLARVVSLPAVLVIS